MVHRAWNHALRIAGQVDRGFGIAKRLYGALQPALMDLGGSGVHSSVMQGISNYERGRDQVLGGYNKVQGIQAQIRRAVPEIEL